jgi:hypothetical protein
MGSGETGLGLSRRTMLAAVALIVLSASCGRQTPPERPKAAAPELVAITQFYTSASSVANGEKALLCYGVENARTVWLEPPRQELSAALSRCVEVAPEATTTYILTAEGSDGKSVSKTLTVPVGAARARIVNVNVSSLSVKPGELVNLCYSVENAKSVTIAPIAPEGLNKAKGCVSDQPRQSTTYVVTAIGGGGDRDQEKVTVTVH